LSFRFGINNVTDIAPPLADSDTGFQRGAGTNPRGRAFYSQISKRI
jgi:outer membrane receptor protein involved in Fe transport